MRGESVVVGVAVAHACADCWRLVWCLPAGLRPAGVPAGLRPAGLRLAGVLAGLPAGLRPAGVLAGLPAGWRVGWPAGLPAGVPARLPSAAGVLAGLLTGRPAAGGRSPVWLIRNPA